MAWGASEHCPYLQVRIHRFLGNFENSPKNKDSVAWHEEARNPFEAHLGLVYKLAGWLRHQAVAILFIRHSTD